MANESLRHIHNLYKMEGGEIRNNEIQGSYSASPDGCGGGVCILGSSSFIMTGGTINGNNIASNQGNALYVESGSTATNGGTPLATGAHDTTITGVP